MGLSIVHVYNNNLPANGLYFLTYEAIQDEVKRRSGSQNPGLLPTIFAGGAAGMAYWIPGMPPDVMKSRLQTAPEGKYPKGIRSVFVDMVKNESPFAFYRGVIPVMIRAFPANAATFFGIELANMFFRVVAPDF